MDAKRLAYWVSLSDPKYLPMMGMPLFVVYLAGGPPSFWLIVGGGVAVVVLNTMAVLVNMLKDRHADQINIPDGASAIQRYVGYERLGIWIAAGAALLVTATVTMWMSVSPQVAILYAIGALIAINYSAGLRLKRSLLASRIAVACGPAISFAGGWALREPLANLPTAIAILFVGHGLHLLIKDIPDAEGDRRMGVRTLFTGRHATRLRSVLPVLWAIPFALAAGGVLAGWWPTRYLALAVLYPFGLLVIGVTVTARDQHDRESARELAQIYAMTFVCANLFLFAPTAVTVTLIVASYAMYLTILALRIDRRQQAHGLTVLARFVPGRNRPAREQVEVSRCPPRPTSLRVTTSSSRRCSSERCGSRTASCAPT